MTKKNNTPENQAQCAIQNVNTSALTECYWCYEKFEEKDTRLVHSAEFMGGSFPICKSCNDEFDFLHWC